MIIPVSFVVMSLNMHLYSPGVRSPNHSISFLSSAFLNPVAFIIDPQTRLICSAIISSIYINPITLNTDSGSRAVVFGSVTEDHNKTISNITNPAFSPLTLTNPAYGEVPANPSAILSITILYPSSP
jgi:hypothetical protein